MKMKNGIFKFKRIMLLGSAITALSACESGPVANSNNRMVFSTPDQGVGQLVAANRSGDRDALLRILGPQAEKLVYSGDPVADRDNQERFVAAYDAFHKLESDDGKKILIIGEEQWPMPIPLTHVEGGWAFDTAEGEQAIIDRRIGRNELDVIGVCRDYVDAQHEYAAWHKRRYGNPEYAQRINSSAGMHDGLYWPVKPHEAQSPFGPLMADAQAEGYDRISGQRQPYHGYYFRVLKQQGPNAAGGARDYIVNGHMVRGFALIAVPAVYGDSGIQSFIVNHNGIVYQADLGPDTSAAAAQITSYDPGEEWRPVR